MEEIGMEERWLAICFQWPYAEKRYQEPIAVWNWVEEYADMYHCVHVVAPGIHAMYDEDTPLSTGGGEGIRVWKVGEEEEIYIKRKFGLAMRLAKVIKKLS